MYFHISNPMKDKPVKLPQGNLLLTPGKETSLKWWRGLPNSHSLRAALPGFLISHACPFHWIRAAIPPCLLSQAKYSFSCSLHSSTADPLPLLSPTCHYISVKNNRTSFQRDESLLPRKIKHRFWHWAWIQSLWNIKRPHSRSWASSTTPGFSF